MGKLIGIELYKLFRSRKPYVFAAIMVVILLLNFSGYSPGDPMYAWTFRHGQSAPLNTLDLLTQFMMIFIPIVLGDSVTNEHRRGMLKLPLLRPVRRSVLLGAKFASLLVFIVLMAAFYVGAAYAIGSHFLGWGDGTEYAGRVVPASEGIRLTLAAAGLLVLPYAAYGLFAGAVAVLVGRMSVAVIVSLVAAAIASNLNAIEAFAPWSLVDQMVSYHEAIIADPDPDLALRRTGVIALYAAVFGLIAFGVFRKKDILH